MSVDKVGYPGTGKQISLDATDLVHYKLDFSKILGIYNFDYPLKPFFNNHLALLRPVCEVGNKP